MAERFPGKKSMPAKKPIQWQGVESNVLDYYDIMVIGKTGMGKSTTVDKMLIARLEGSQPPQEGSNGSSQHQEPVYDGNECKLVCDDLTMWLVSGKPTTEKDYDDNSIVKVSLRLKNLVFFRSLKNPHKEINQSRETDMNIYESTLECELLSNENTKIRILDVPGFFGREASGNEVSAELRGKDVVGKGLSSMRKVLRIKNAHNLKFRRVVYFLPEKGVLKRTDQHLILELQIMEKHFGRAIFDNMVVIATESLGAYKFASSTSIMYAEEDFKKTKYHLQDALKIVFGNKDVPEPPIEFISLFDTCETILHKIQSAEVKQDMIMLKFKHSFCARCGLTIVEEGENKSESVYCTSPDRSGPVLLEQSTCHPAMIPKYSALERVVGGVLHLVTLRQFVGKWPSFLTMDEVCIKCKEPPKSHGCMLIGSKFEGANDDGTVRHSSSAVETYQVRVQEDDSEPIPIPPSISPPPGAETSAVVAMGPGFPVSGSEPSLHLEPGKEVFTQKNYDNIKG